MIDRTLLDRFSRHHYVRVAPLAWVHERDGSAVRNAALAAARRLHCAVTS